MASSNEYRNSREYTCYVCGQPVIFRQTITVGGEVKRRPNGRPFPIHPDGTYCNHIG